MSLSQPLAWITLEKVGECRASNTHKPNGLVSQAATMLTKTLKLAYRSGVLEKFTSNFISSTFTNNKSTRSTYHFSLLTQ